LVDDMGFSDPGCFGGEIHTPNLDLLAANGIRFTSFYNAGRCCPTRASLLTGLYPHQTGIGQMTFDKGEEYPGYRGFLKENTVTIAEVLKEAGYSTGMVGKWHVSPTFFKGDRKNDKNEQHMTWLNRQGFYEDDFADVQTYPTARGFEKYYGNIWGVVNYFDPFSLVDQTQPVKEVPKDYYLTDAISDKAVDYIETFSKQDKPFFLYVAHCAPHWPLHAQPEDIKKYEKTYQVGWDAIREQRFKKQKELGLFKKETLDLSPPVKREISWKKEPNQQWEAQIMGTHAAMVDRVDQGLGSILAKLKETGELDNTLILFLSDNGASPERYGMPGNDRNSQTRDGRTVHYNTPAVPPGADTSYMYLGKYWANVANTPFKYWKARTYEGGICTPFIAHWPEGIKEQKGTINDSPGHIIDLMATCLDLGKAKYPDSRNGQTITPYQGKSLAPLFSEGKREGHQALFFEHFYSKALRQNNWKLVAFPNNEWELYNLDEDRFELNNLTPHMPEKVAELTELWEQLGKKYDVFPQPPIPEWTKRVQKAY